MALAGGRPMRTRTLALVLLLAACGGDEDDSLYTRVDGEVTLRSGFYGLTERACPEGTDCIAGTRAIPDVAVAAFAPTDGPPGSGRRIALTHSRAPGIYELPLPDSA